MSGKYRQQVGSWLQYTNTETTAGSRGAEADEADEAGEVLEAPGCQECWHAQSTCIVHTCSAKTLLGMRHIPSLLHYFREEKNPGWYTRRPQSKRQGVLGRRQFGQPCDGHWSK